jgi:hypothetical protein
MLPLASSRGNKVNLCEHHSTNPGQSIIKFWNPGSNQKTDNGSPFNSQAFDKFTTNSGFTHRRVTPHWPRANASTSKDSPVGDHKSPYGGVVVLSGAFVTYLMARPALAPHVEVVCPHNSSSGRYKYANIDLDIRSQSSL